MGMGCSDLVDSGRHIRRPLQYTWKKMILAWYKAVILKCETLLPTRRYLATFETFLVVTTWGKRRVLLVASSR